MRKGIYSEWDDPQNNFCPRPTTTLANTVFATIVCVGAPCFWHYTNYWHHWVEVASSSNQAQLVNLSMFLIGLLRSTKSYVSSISYAYAHHCNLWNYKRYSKEKYATLNLIKVFHLNWKEHNFTAKTPLKSLNIILRSIVFGVQFQTTF